MDPYNWVQGFSDKGYNPKPVISASSSKVLEDLRIDRGRHQNDPVSNKHGEDA